MRWRERPWGRWLETPSNPELNVCDIAALAGAAHAAGALVVVDNTLATRLVQRPLDLGADFAVPARRSTSPATATSSWAGQHARPRARGGDPGVAPAAGAILGPFEGGWRALAAHASPPPGPRTANAQRARRLARARVGDVAACATGPTRGPGPRDGRPADDRFGTVLGFDRRAPSAAGFLGRCSLVYESTSFGGVHSTAERRRRWGDGPSRQGTYGSARARGPRRPGGRGHRSGRARSTRRVAGARNVGRAGVPSEVREPDARGPPATIHVCAECGHQEARWHGRCPGCGAWNTLVEERAGRAPRAARAATAAGAARPAPLRDVRAEAGPRLETGIGELDRVLGGGLVPGSLVLLGGSPGIGKSTLTGDGARQPRRAGRDGSTSPARSRRRRSGCAPSGSARTRCASRSLAETDAGRRCWPRSRPSARTSA